MLQDPLRLALIGTGKRQAYLYEKLVRAMPEVDLVGLWGRSQESAQRMGDELGIPWYSDLDRLVRETGAQIGIVSVAYSANGEVGLMAVQAGLHVLLETPIAHQLSEADAIIEAAWQKNVKVEMAEQFHRRPQEALKLKLLACGLFGAVYSSFSDFAGHGYHGMSIMRSYLGFDAKPLRVVGSVGHFPLTAHYSRIRDNYDPHDETQEHAIVEFAGGQIGIFHWTNVGYDSPLRWWRSSRFLAERGMGMTSGVGFEVDEQMSLLAPGGEAPAFVRVERRYERVDGGALEAVIAHTGDPDMPIVRWDNPFAALAQWHDDEIGVAGCIKSLVDAVNNDTEPTYGPLQGRLDQELIIALRQSAADGGRPVDLPLDPAQQTV